MMIVAGHLKYGVPTFKVVAQNQASCLKLSQHPVDGCQAHVITLFEELFVHILGAEVMLLGVLQNIEDLHSWQSDFKTDFS
jgi:hypothetical protein